MSAPGDPGPGHPGPELPGLRVVALGGGHGLHATLRAARRLTDDVTAVVTVADDGGSSGRIRRELDILPLGDLRMALNALADDGPGGPAPWRAMFEHRFGGTGALAGHAAGNLVLAGLLGVTGDPVAALDEACRLLGVRGRVLPMSPQPVDIEADVTGIGASDSAHPGSDDVVHRIRGQVAVATTPGRVRRVRLDPRRPRACAAAVEAIGAADVVVLGPGSWFTSVLPHLLVPDIYGALCATAARRVLVLNLAPQPGETAGFSPQEHLDVITEHAPRLRLDVVVADPVAAGDPDRLRRGAEVFGAEVLLAGVGEPGGAPRHDPDALASALATASGRRGTGAPPRPSGPSGLLHDVSHGPEEDQRWP